MRLDVYLYETKTAKSRTEAKNLILSGCVTVGGNVVTKPAFEVAENADVSVVREEIPYVSRGGYKLQGALEAFLPDVSKRLCLDVGASSGGFTDCLLRHGVSRVIALDVGTSQLSASLRTDPRVFVMEQYNARYLKAQDLPYVPDLAVMDVSFISATLLLPAVYAVLAPRADFICLIKPQFEVGRQNLGKGGIVKDEKTRLSAVDRVREAAESIGFQTIGVIPSPLPGGDGNLEYLACFRKDCL